MRCRGSDNGGGHFGNVVAEVETVDVPQTVKYRCIDSCYLDGQDIAVTGIGPYSSPGFVISVPGFFTVEALQLQTG